MGVGRGLGQSRGSSSVTAGPKVPQSGQPSPATWFQRETRGIHPQGSRGQRRSPCPKSPSPRAGAGLCLVQMLNLDCVANVDHEHPLVSSRMPSFPTFCCQRVGGDPFPSHPSPSLNQDPPIGVRRAGRTDGQEVQGPLWQRKGEEERESRGARSSPAKAARAFLMSSALSKSVIDILQLFERAEQVRKD